MLYVVENVYFVYKESSVSVSLVQLMAAGDVNQWEIYLI